MTPTKDLLEGSWISRATSAQQISDMGKLIRITFDKLPFDHFEVVRITTKEGKKESVIYSGEYFIHQNAADEFVIAIRNKADDKEIIIQCSGYNEDEFSAELGEYGTMIFIKDKF